MWLSCTLDGAGGEKAGEYVECKHGQLLVINRTYEGYEPNRSVDRWDIGSLQALSLQIK